MPELPEVETVVRDLRRAAVGQTISAVEVRSAKQVSPAPAAFRRALVGARLATVERRAKVLAFQLSNGRVLVVHLKMTGQLIYRSRAGRLRGGGHPFGIEGLGLPNRYTQVTFSFRSGDRLYFNDTRRFGYLKLLTTVNWQHLCEHGWGVDPLSRGFTGAALAAACQRRPRLTIKQLLMDQAVFAGIGNIYADETLFRARVQPSRACRSLTAAEAKATVASARAVLGAAIRHGGTTVNDYVTGHGQPGSYGRYLKVYGRAGQPCVRCRTPLRRTVIGGRGTVHCPRCQR